MANDRLPQGWKLPQQANHAAGEIRRAQDTRRRPARAPRTDDTAIRTRPARRTASGPTARGLRRHRSERECRFQGPGDALTGKRLDVAGGIADDKQALAA